MVKKIPETPVHATDLSDSVKDSAQQIWQAGLAAFARAQAEGSKAFESLVKEGVEIQHKTTSKMSTMASDFSSRATGPWDKLETIFEDRVAKALNRLGMPSAQDLQALTARIDELQAAVQKLSSKPAAPGTEATAARKTGAKASAKPTAKAAVKAVAKKSARA